MDIHIDILKITEEMIKEYEKTETHAILFYSQDKNRDFKIMAEKMSSWRKRIERILSEDAKTITGN